MKICFIADSSSIHAQRIVSYYVAKGDDILVLSTARRISDISGTRTEHLLFQNSREVANPLRKRTQTHPWIARLKSLVPLWLIVEFKRITRALRLLRQWKFCVEEIRCFNADVIYCFRCFPEGILALRCGVSPWLLRTAGPDISKLPRYPIYRTLIRKALQSADVVVTESLWERRLLQHLCGSGTDPKVNIIGVDTDIFRPSPCRDRLREKYGISPNSFVIVSNRYLVGHYNGWLVVQAVQSLMERCPHLTLLYVNPGKMALRTKTKAAGIAQRFPQIKFIEGPVSQSEMADILGCGDAYVTFSSADGIPNSLLEAMACGVVPIVADLPQVREWIEHCKNGYLVLPGDTAGLASTIYDLCANRQVLSEMSQRCVAKIRGAASYEECSKRTRTLLYELARKQDGQCPVVKS